MARIRRRFGGADLAHALEEYGDQIESEVKRIVAETAYIIQSNARSLAPVDDGNLRSSIEVQLLEGGLTARVTVSAHYAIYVEYGTGIYAKNGDGRTTPWTYYSTKLGRYVTTRGQRPQEFWGPAVDIGERHFRQAVGGLG
ncbi:HK97-gp10 family putative phage morphogenesis protein [Metabacillus fastidiosus]|uniref:HK97-gp10 family putative phage morphogenesis protein n=1 Tax=Metabacillus fastidiosus TaxID=1458 RepID=UPI0008242632|nr:HK97-gp10 family putative phage morphogenesis protein [Metabacillus fastidiosus]MED4461860.1 HK97 gp10 family phage protein [Metabacillus fastidiosus]